MKKRRQNAPSPQPGEGTGPALPLVIGLGALVVYLATLAPSVPGGDSGELIAVAYTGGVAHPPGYPLYTMLARLFTHAIPFGSVALKINLLSALLGAGAAGFLALAVARWTRGAAAGAFAGALLAFSPRVWDHAIVAEVFALNNFLLAALLSVCVSKPTRLWPAFLLGGLALANHHTSVFFVAPLLISVIWGRERAEWPKAAAAFAAGLLPYLYLPIAATNLSPVSWGEASTWSGFWKHFFRAEYGTFQLANEALGGQSRFFGNLWLYFKDLLRQGLAVGVVFAILGARFACRERFGKVIALSFAGYVIVFHSLSNLPADGPLFVGVLGRFWQQANLFAFALAGVGLARVPDLRARYVLAAVVAAVGIAWHFPSARVHSERWIERYGREILEKAPQGALILSRGDLVTNSIRYLQAVEGLRRDVKVLDQEILSLPWMKALYSRQFPEVLLPGSVYNPNVVGGFDMKALLDANSARFPIWVCGGLKPGDPSGPTAYELWPVGLCSQAHSKDRLPAAGTWLLESEKALPEPVTGRQFPPESWEVVVARDFWEARHARALHVLNSIGAEQALPLYQELVKSNPRPEPHVYKNWGIAASRLMDRKPELVSEMVRAWEKYLPVAPATDPDLPTIRQAVAHYGGAKK